VEAHNPINKIREHRDTLRKSERKVADFILENSTILINMRIVDVASSAEVSEPTVLRFCRALGYDGFQSFKLQLAQHLGANSGYSQFSVDDNDTAADLCSKVVDSAITTKRSPMSVIDLAAASSWGCPACLARTASTPALTWSWNFRSSPRKSGRPGETKAWRRRW